MSVTPAESTSKIIGPGFYSQLLKIAGPIMIQSLLGSSLSFVDTLMIGQLGDVQIASVGLANQMFFLIILILFGVSSGSSVFIAQFWGSKNLGKIYMTMGISMILSLAAGLLFSLTSVISPRFVMAIFSPDPAVIEAGAVYLRIVGVSYLFTAVSIIFAFALRSTEQTQIPLIGTAVSVVMNIVLNYILIFGKLGFPAMGIAGAAIATTISRFFEMVIILFFTYRKKLPVAGSLSSFLTIDRAFVPKYFKTALPVILNEVIWSVGMVVYKIVFARMGTHVIASANVVEAIQGLYFVVFMGTSSGCAVMIGKRIGEKQYQLAGAYARRFMLIALGFGAVMGLAMFLLAPILPQAFNVSGEIMGLTTRSLMMIGLIFPFKAFNMHTIVGILRSGGDTRISLFIELTSVWLVGVPLALFGGFFLSLTLDRLYLLLGLEEIYKAAISTWRIRSKRWINDLTLH